MIDQIRDYLKSEGIEFEEIQRIICSEIRVWKYIEEVKFQIVFYVYSNEIEVISCAASSSNSSIPIDLLHWVSDPLEPVVDYKIVPNQKISINRLSQIFSEKELLKILLAKIRGAFESLLPPKMLERLCEIDPTFVTEIPKLFLTDSILEKYSVYIDLQEINL